jgi:hypothetical protein
MLPDLRLAYSLSQTGSNREMLDAGETHMSKFLQLLVCYFNDPSLEVSTPCQPSLHCSFAEPIACNKGEFELTESKAKKLFSHSRRYLTTMINDGEKSGNGSNQRLDISDDVQDFVFDLWGRFDAETCDGDDRANFLSHLPHYWLMVWHLCDEGDLLRFTCAQLRDDHTASSLSAPPSVSRGSGSARKFAQQTLELHKQIAESVKNIGMAVARCSDDTSYERASKIRRLDKLRADRYLVFRDSKCQASSQDERDAAADYVRELDEMIDELKAELRG